MTAPPVITLSPDRLYALANPYEIDGRVSWHPPGVRGFAPMNCYLLVEGERALLIDSGVTVHRDALIEQLRQALPAAARLAVLHTRLGEYNSLCNTPAVAARFDVREVCGPHLNADLWTDFEPHSDAAGDGFGHAIGPVEVRLLGNEQELSVDAAGRRRVQVFAAVLRLLPTHWAFDEATGTLFTSDMFSHVRRPGPGGPWTVGAADDTSLETVREHMLETRYWWLPGADTDEIAAGLAEVFGSRRVERIAPGYGCILEGEGVVARHLEMVQEVLE
jgi:hypothetical protein